MAFSRHHSGSAGVTGASHTSGHDQKAMAKPSGCCWGSCILVLPPGSCVHLVLQSLAKETSFLADGIGGCGMWGREVGGSVLGLRMHPWVPTLLRAGCSTQR